MLWFFVLHGVTDPAHALSGVRARGAGTGKMRTCGPTSG